MKKYSLIIVLMLCFTITATCEEYAEYKVVPFIINESSALNIVFGSNIDKALKEGDDSTISYKLTNNEVNNYFVQSIWDSYPFQKQIIINIESAKNPFKYLDIADNTLPNLNSSMKLQASEAIKESTEICQSLGIENTKLWHVVAMGKYNRPFYKILLGQTIDRLNVYWSYKFNKLEVSNIISNTILIKYGDYGLINLSGMLSNFKQAGKKNKIIDTIKISEKIENYDELKHKIELCYLIYPIGNDAIAIPAYRYINTFYNAYTGEVLQY